MVRDLARLGIAAAVVLVSLCCVSTQAQAQRYSYRLQPQRYGQIPGAYPRYSLGSSYLPSVVSGAGLYYGQYSPIMNQARFYSSNRPQYTAPDRYQQYTGPGTASRLYYYGGLYRTPSRLYPGGSRVYGSRYGTYTSPYSVNRPYGGTILSTPLRVSPRVRYRFVQ